MNQKNLFSIIGIVLILQGIAFFFMKDQMVTDTFPGVDATGHDALNKLIEVMSALSIIIGLTAWTGRNSPAIIPGFAIGSLVLVCVTAKHMFIDHVNVPVFAYVIQFLILLACMYLWTQKKA
jgi:hypothetical protein